MSENILERIKHPPPEAKRTWWQRLQEDINVKACAVGFLACGLTLFAILSAMRHEAGTSLLLLPISSDKPVIAPRTAPMAVTPPKYSSTAVPPAAPSTAPVLLDESTGSTPPASIINPQPVNYLRLTNK